MGIGAPAELIEMPARGSARIPVGKVKLERALSKLGLASRTQARAMILEGRVRVGGQIVRDPERWVSPETARIEIDGEKVAKQARRVFMLHKPRSTVTTRNDERHRRTVFDVARAARSDLPAHLIAVGRLDFATTGLLLLTNDSRLADELTDPRHGIRRVYLATVRGEVTPIHAKTLEDGVIDRGERLRAERVELRKTSGKESRLMITLSEGKNREVRRLCSAIGHEVTALKRIQYGGLALGELEPGELRELSAKELALAFPTLASPALATRGPPSPL